jgi:hypothetical protein
VAIPQGRRASPWPFVAMMGMAATFFLYAVSGLLAPWYGVVLLLLVWVGLFVVACRWWTPHPKLMLLLPVVAVAVWFAVLTLGEALFDWTA